MVWNKEYKGISIRFEDRVVRILCDDVLMDYLAQPGNDAVILSKYILETYFDMFHKELEISQHSLAVEILIHAYIDKLCLYIEQKKVFPIQGLDQALNRAVAMVEERTNVIDCGERAIDSNRFVFDGLEKFHGAIYKFLGDLA